MRPTAPPALASATMRHRADVPSLMRTVMRIASALPLIVLLVGSCASLPATDTGKDCGLSSSDGWSFLTAPPIEEATLRSQLATNPSYNQFGSGRPNGRTSWLTAAGPHRLAYCYQVNPQRSRCNGYTATFTLRGAAWIQDEEVLVRVCN